MNNRDRFNLIMRFETPDRYLNSEIGVWEQTIDRWENESMPHGAIKDIIMLWEDDFFGLDVHKELHIEIMRPFPFREKKILKEDDKYKVFIDEYGRQRRSLKEGAKRDFSTSMDQYLDFPVKNRDSWREWKNRFIGHSNNRYPANWSRKVREWKDRDYILFAPGLGQVSFFGFLRNLMGLEGACYIFYDDTKLVEEIFDFLTEYFMDILEKALKEVEIDWFMFWEDIAYKNAPLISPDMIKKYMSPKYKIICELLRKYGINSIFLDTDGNLEKLLPLFIEAGINGTLPIEVNAGNDVVELRKEYGKDLLMLGGINKMSLSKGKKEIKEEIYTKIVPIIDKGGYIPTIDHTIPPDVPYENFLFYLEIKNKVLSGNL